MANVTEKLRMVPDRLIKCLERDGFIEEVNSRVSSSKSQSQAFNEVAHEVEKHFDKKMYSDYQSFRVINSRYNKSKKQNPK